MTDTQRYYDTHATAFFAETVEVDMGALHARFVARLKPGARILDAGCGSGRDARAFRALGYAVTAFDASPTLAALASEHCGCAVEVLRFEEVSWRDCFDGIWACASLLHVPLAGLPEVLRRLTLALKHGGVLYASFKYGTGEREHRGRRFTDLDEAGLMALLAEVGRLEPVEVWTTLDQRPGREHERWLNALLRRSERV